MEREGGRGVCTCDMYVLLVVFVEREWVMR